MKVYTYSEARQRLASLLEQSRREGQVRIRRRDGQVFVVQPAAAAGSPLDVPAVRAHLRRGELAALLQESRETGHRFWGTRRTQSARRAKRR
jgi:prevent-host-death family protein